MLDIVEPLSSVVWEGRMEVALDLLLMQGERFRWREEQYVVGEAHQHARESNVVGLMSEWNLFRSYSCGRR